MVRINSLKKVSLILSLALVGMACTTTPKNTEETMRYGRVLFGHA